MPDAEVAAPPFAPPASKNLFLILALLTTLLVVVVRLWNLATIQTDVYGDIQIVYVFVDGVRQGHWPLQYVLGVGPLYQYLITPLIMLIGLNYYTLKLCAVLTSLGALAATFLFARRLNGDYFALLAVAIAGVSSWLLIFSRLGISLILVPLLVMAALWLLLRFVQERRRADLLACSVVSGLGLYAYPQAFVLPLALLLTLLCLRWLGHRIAWGDVGRFVVASIVTALPFGLLVLRDPTTYAQGYIGSKFPAADELGSLWQNFVSAALAYHVRGDIINRSNPIYLPHLDQISGVLLLAGVVYWLLPERRLWSPLLLVPFVLLHLPSILVLGRPNEVPSAGRTLGAAPIAYILIASGIWWILVALAKVDYRRTGTVIAAILFALILVLNVQRYLGAYIDGLPYHDTSIGEQIVRHSDALSPDTQVYIAGCCWEGGMPELPYVQLMAQRPANLHALDATSVTCEQLDALAGPAVLVWSFHDPIPAPQLAACQGRLPAQLYVSPTGLPVFTAAPLLRGP